MATRIKNVQSITIVEASESTMQEAQIAALIAANFYPQLEGAEALLAAQTLLDDAKAL